MVLIITNENQGLSTFPDNPRDSRFSDFEPFLAVSRLESEISQIITEVCHFSLIQLSDKEISDILHCLSYFTVNIERFSTNSGIPIMLLVGSKPIRSNVTISTTSFLRIFISQMVSCFMHYDIIYHPFPTILNICRHGVGEGGLTALRIIGASH